jgi:type II secretory pathway pseudopilin PulG
MARHNTQGPAGGPGLLLLEPMLVVVIILSLAALVMPQFSLVRERARKAACVSNQRNLETAVAMWTTDNPSTAYVGGTMDLSTPDFAALAGSVLYTTAASFKEPDDPNPSNVRGTDYYLSMGGPIAELRNETAASYGHVACAADRVPDPWVAGYDGTLGSISGITHTRGAAASP